LITYKSFYKRILYFGLPSVSSLGSTKILFYTQSQLQFENLFVI
jgi:hypothetical protein